ncbi:MULTISPECIES: SDR family oxidoreductase [Flavobacteriaceae]|uniref:SDR family oxidoreductase n=1 Tax=Flavobacteriaceae TaxID=49546 RepID=UPI0014930F4C|nr:MULTISPECIES: SDR family oxidoreductase [Allomuricauda]MDC6367321.1 SDR family oxidoreductase [Muricauda sp. AC10]
MKRFKNKVLVVTGASKKGGVGACVAKLFVEEGAKVLMLDMDEENGNDLQEELGESTLFKKCNIALEESVKSCITEGISKFGDIDYLVNNAAILGYTAVHETSLDEWNKIIGVNVTGQFLCAKHVLPSMMKKENGAIVNVGSAQSFMSQKKVAPYVTSKTAILGLTRSIAVDYTPKIRCNAVCPSTIDTPMLQWALKQSPDPQAVLQESIDMHLLKRIAKPEEIASLIAFLCSDAAANITGQSFRSDGGIGLLIEGSKQELMETEHLHE